MREPPSQEVAGAHVGGAGAGGHIVPGAAEVGFPGRIGHFLGEGFIFAGAADRQVLPLRREGRGFVAIAGDAQLFPKAFRQFPGEGGAFLQRDA